MNTKIILGSSWNWGWTTDVAWTILTMSLLPFGGLNVSVVLLSLQGQKAIVFLQKYLNLCSKDEQRSYRFGTTWRWVIDDRILVFGWTIPLNMFQCTGQAFMSASVYLQRACFRPKHDIIKTWTESLMLMLFTESTWNCLLVLNRDLSNVFFFWESGSLAESPFAPFWSSCSPKDPYGFTNAEHSWSWTKWTRVPTRSRAGYISLTVVSVCHGSNVSLNRGEAWAKSLNIKKNYVCMDTISACICKKYNSAFCIEFYGSP